MRALVAVRGISIRLLVVALILAACRGDTSGVSDSRWHGSGPSFLLLSNGVEGTSCSQTPNPPLPPEAWSPDADTHFQFLNILFFDEAGSQRSQCGDLLFVDQPGTVRAQWTPNDINTYSTWLLKARSTDPLLRPDSMVQLSHTWVPQGVFKDTTFSISLPSWADVLSLRLHTSSLVSTTPAAFDAGCEEACVQHWQHIGAPTFDSARIVSDSSVRLWWQNRNAQRPIDSTLLVRNGVAVRSFGSATTSFTDGPLAVGTYTYKLRHFALPSPHTILLAIPNSAFSRETTLTVGPPPPTALVCEGNFSPTIDCHWTISTRTDSTLVFRNFGGAPTVRLDTGVAAWTDNGVMRGTSYTYEVAAKRGSFLGARSAPVSVVANPTPPTIASCVKTGIASARCTWLNTEPDGSTAMQRQEAGTWGPAGSVVAGITQLNDTGLHGGVTYSYRLRHFKNADSSGFSGTLAVAIDSPPPPTSLACRGNFNPWIDCAWTNTDPTDSTILYRNGSVRARLPNTQNSVTDDPVTGDATYTYSVRHKDRAVLGPSSPTITETATAEAPANLSCGGTGLTSVTCVWVNTEMGDTLIIEHSRIPNKWIFRTLRSPPHSGYGEFTDTGLQTGVTYTYRTYYRKGARTGRYSNLDPARPDSISEPYRPVGP